jgi:NADH-quinone oxidoreductase subunit M
MNLLIALTFLPIAGIVPLFLFKGEKQIRTVATVVCAIEMLLSIALWWGFDATKNAVLGTSQYAVNASWIKAGNFDIHFAMDVDGISVLLIVLTGILGLIACISAYGVQKNVRGFYCMYLLLLAGMVGTFVSTDLFLFYVFWELMLLPMYFLIGLWGGPKREFAAIKFFIYTLVGSVLMLGAFLAIYFQMQDIFHAPGFKPEPGEWAFSMPFVLKHHAEMFAGSSLIRMLLFIGLFIGFAIKVPVFPFHTWLPLAHVEAPTPISVILAGVLLKMGGYGMMRMAFPWFPDVVVKAWPWLATLAIISIVYGALVAMAQTDWKKLVAYSSVSHMGYVLLGLATLTPAGVNGAVLQMFSHGILSGMMFLLVGVMYDQVHHRDMNRFGGLATSLPKYTFIAMIGFFGSLGLPGLSGFIGEMLVFFGSFGSKLPDAKLYTVVATLGVVLGAVYILVMIQKIFLGKAKERHEHELKEPSVREWTMLAPLAVMAIWIGVWPRVAIDVSDRPVQTWCDGFKTAIDAHNAKEAGK